MRESCATPSTSRISAACFIVAQSDWLPMTMATGAFKIFGPSCDDIGNQHVLDVLYLIFQVEFHFFQAPELELVTGSGFLQRGNGHVEVAVLLQQMLQLCAKCHLLQRVHGPQPAPKA